jgi:hypothetical protein
VARARSGPSLAFSAVRAFWKPDADDRRSGLIGVSDLRFPVVATRSRRRSTCHVQCGLPDQVTLYGRAAISRRLWLNVHEPAAWEEPESGSAQAVGLEIGRMAHLLFPSGVLVEEKPWEHAAAVARTAALMADRSVPAIFEAAFEHSGVRVRVDVLERLPRGYWGMREVKSSGEVKDHHYDDVAVQIHVLRSAGVRLSSVEILHVNKDYVRSQKGISWPKFFHRVEVKTEARARLDGVDMRLKKRFRSGSRSTSRLPGRDNWRRGRLPR